MEFTAYAAFIFLGASATVNGVALPFLIDSSRCRYPPPGPLMCILSDT